MTRVVTLRIKKKWFDKIASGEKTTEYREVKKFYQELFENKPKVTHLRLHYQSSRQMIVEVRFIRKQRESRASQLYAIYLGPITHLSA